VLEFKKRVRENHEVLYGEFDGEPEFQGLLRDLLTELVVSNRQKADQPQGTSASGLPTPNVTPERELDEAQEQIAGTLLAYADLVREGRAPAELDSDRLLQIALVFQEDGAVLPAHACNRLYLKRKDLVLARGEYSLWLDTLLQQARTAAVESVTPGWFLISTGTSTSWHGIGSEVAKRLRANDAMLVNGALTILSRARLRPRVLWQDDTENGLGTTGWKDVMSSLVDPESLSAYLLTVCTESDAEALSHAADEVEYHEDVFQGVLASIRRDADVLNSLVDRRGLNVLRWPKKIIARHLRLLHPEKLSEILEWSTDDELRWQAFEILLEGGNLSNESWQSGLMLASNSERVGKAFAFAFALPTADREALAEFIDKSKSENKAEIVARLRLPQAVKTVLSKENPEDLETWEAASWTGDPSLLNHARHVLQTDGSDYSKPLESLSEEVAPPDKAAKLVDFVRAKARTAAIRVLQRNSQDHLQPDDASIFADLLENPYVAQNRKRLGHALRLAGHAKARELAQSDIEPVSVSAVRYLCDDVATTSEELLPYLHSPHSSARSQAVEGIIRRSSRNELEALIAAYPTSGEKGSYFYNVMARLDDFLYGPENAVSNPSEERNHESTSGAIAERAPRGTLQFGQT
jgi:hypothetical protein